MSNNYYDPNTYCKDCDRSIYGKYPSCDTNIENNGKYTKPGSKCYCKVKEGIGMVEKYPWEEKEMSAFMCSPRTISIIADVMSKRAWPSTPVKETFSDLVGMNIDALMARYKEVSVDKKSFKYVETEYSLIEAIKCMDCYLYQCSEGDNHTRYMFQEIVMQRDKLIVDYMHEKIMNSPEYEALPWE